jgi:multidrug transporter EmrE-like cation transporter
MMKSTIAQETPTDTKKTAERTPGAKSMLSIFMIIAIPTIAGVIGQMMLKVGMSNMGALDLSVAGLPAIALKIITSPMIILGLAVYMGGVFFWLIGLNQLDLSYLYPFASLGYVLIAIASWVFLGEQIPPLRWVGLLVICLCVVLTAKK